MSQFPSCGIEKGREAVREADEMTDFFFFLMGLNVLQYSKSEASAE